MKQNKEIDVEQIYNILLLFIDLQAVYFSFSPLFSLLLCCCTISLLILIHYIFILVADTDTRIFHQFVIAYTIIGPTTVVVVVVPIVPIGTSKN